MNENLEHYLTIVLLFLIAFVFYALSLQGGTILFLVIGVLFEGSFWFKLFNGKKKAKT